MKSTKKTLPISKKSIVIILVIALVAVAGVILYKSNHRNKQGAVSTQTTTSTITTAPATEEEKQASEQHKEDLNKRITQEQASGSASGTSKKQVTPYINFADKTTVNASVVDIFEDGGTCTATLTQGSKTITRTSVGFKNVSYTQCAPIDLTSTDLGAGGWSVVVTYSSATAEGKSQPRAINP